MPASGAVRRDRWTGLFECCSKDAEGRKRVKFVLRDDVAGSELVVVRGGEKRPSSRCVRPLRCPLACDPNPARAGALTP